MTATAWPGRGGPVKTESPYDLVSWARETVGATPKWGVASPWACVGDTPIPTRIRASLLERFISSLQSLQIRVREGRDSKLTPGERHGRGSWVWSHTWAPVPAPAFLRCVALDKSFHLPELWFLLLSLEVNKWQWYRVGGTGKLASRRKALCTVPAHPRLSEKPLPPPFSFLSPRPQAWFQLHAWVTVQACALQARIYELVSDHPKLLDQRCPVELSAAPSPVATIHL